MRVPTQSRSHASSALDPTPPPLTSPAIPSPRFACPAKQPPYISNPRPPCISGPPLPGNPLAGCMVMRSNSPPRRSIEADQHARSSPRGWLGRAAGRGRASPGCPLPPAAAGALGREERHVAREGRVRGRARGAAGRRGQHAVHPCAARLRLRANRPGVSFPPSITRSATSPSQQREVCVEMQTFCTCMQMAVARSGSGCSTPAQPEPAAAMPQQPQGAC